MSPREIKRWVRPYAIVRCLKGCGLNADGNEEIDGENITTLRAIARRHCQETGHVVEFDLTQQTRYAPNGVEPR